MRVAGVETQPVESESGMGELVVPGVVAVPPQQLRIVATPAAGLVETLLVAPDEDVKEGDADRHAEVVGTGRGAARLSARSFGRQSRGRETAARRAAVQGAYHRRAPVDRHARRGDAGAFGARRALANSRARRDDRQRDRDAAQGSKARQLAPRAGADRRHHSPAPWQRPASACRLRRRSSPSPGSIRSGSICRCRLAAPQRSTTFRSRLSVLRGSTAALSASAARSIRRLNRLRPWRRFNPGKTRCGRVRRCRRSCALRGDGAAQWRVPADAMVNHHNHNWVFVVRPKAFARSQ